MFGQQIKVNYEVYSSYKDIKSKLEELNKHSLLAFDFETAVKYTDQEKQDFLRIAQDESLPYLQRREARAKYEATALDHPSHSVITHLNIAWSSRDAWVFVLDNEDTRKLVYDFLVTTNVKQVWHNLGYDGRYILYNTGKFPKDYEDSQIFAKTLINHVDVHKARTGLKELAGKYYGDWGLSADIFSLENIYDETLLRYAATDACATYWVWDRLEKGADKLDHYPSTTDHYSPWDLLQNAKNPKGLHLPNSYFYHYVAKHLVRDTVRLMMNGLPIDLQQVRKLENELVGLIEATENEVNDNPLMREFNTLRQEAMREAAINSLLSKRKKPNEFLKPFKPSDAIHRSFYMDIFADRVGLSKPQEKLEIGASKWSHKLIKQLSATYPFLQSLASKTVDPSSPTAIEAMALLAKAKADEFNAKIKEKINSLSVSIPAFNLGSAQQKQEFFAWLGLESDAKSPTTGLDSWSRDQIERVNKETEDEDVRAITQGFIDHSFAAIVQNNFVQSFYRYTIEGNLQGSYKLLGAKSG